MTGPRIVLTGGGSGGHITPVLAVAHQLKQLQPDCETIYIGQTGDGLGDIPTHDPAIDRVYTVRAGKLRRYHGEGIKQVFDLDTTGKNIRDAGFVAAGLAQSYRLLRRLRPDVAFIKGGFVGVPVGLAAAALDIPFITHDSDALPGLANRIIGRWARLHAVAFPKEVYSYPADKTVSVGVPIGHEFRLRSDQEIRQLKLELGYGADQPILLVTGGGLGAQRLNMALQDIVPALLEALPGLAVVHFTGRQHEQDVLAYYDTHLSDMARSRVLALGFSTELYKYSAIADVVVTRAGMTSVAEFAAQAKACVVVANPILAGGHQLKNAQVLAEWQAVRLVDEAALAADPGVLAAAVQELFGSAAEARRLGESLHELAHPDAARRLAELLLKMTAKAQAVSPGFPSGDKQV